MSTRYTFLEVKAALREHWGLSLHRGGEMTDGTHDGRWDVCYSRTGFIVGGELPRAGHGYRRYETLGQVVRGWELEKVIAKARKSVTAPAPRHPPHAPLIDLARASVRWSMVSPVRAEGSRLPAVSMPRRPRERLSASAETSAPPPPSSPK